MEALRADPDVVLTAVKQSGLALQFATDVVRGDCDVVRAAEQQDGAALQYAADSLLEDPTFATEKKAEFYLLKLTMLSGYSTVVAAAEFFKVSDVLAMCCRRLGFADGTTMELWHGLDRVPDNARFLLDWPGIKPRGEISEYQLVVMR
eukprot:1749284-Amphidinium_carterae.1